MIVAMAENRVIGYKNQLPRDFAKDMNHFRSMTYWSTIVMWRQTYEWIWKPLSGRRNIVISKDNDLPEVESYDDPDLLLSMLDSELAEEDQVFIIWWWSLYAYFLKQDSYPIQYIYLTKINQIVQWDTYFPLFEEHYEEIERVTPSSFINFITYRKKRVE